MRIGVQNDRRSSDSTSTLTCHGVEAERVSEHAYSAKPVTNDILSTAFSPDPQRQSVLSDISHHSKKSHSASCLSYARVGHSSQPNPLSLYSSDHSGYNSIPGSLSIGRSAMVRYLHGRHLSRNPIYMLTLKAEVVLALNPKSFHPPHLAPIPYFDTVYKHPPRVQGATRSSI
jgi:hypothetical protein